MGQEIVAVAPPVAAATPPPTLLPPGFRFQPTDEELVMYYLRRKACGKPFPFQVVMEIDVYKSEPWEVAGGEFGDGISQKSAAANPPDGSESYPILVPVSLCCVWNGSSEP
ncbi:hypothetical protein SSX86_003928 [Deinandra increscens subsp. villosa]|uniref:NAC domain-containing protein n=1 Tax=Deinandra increscens subsp. villosa TaxID=3103831 RepID=A0AAP0DN14_9ASTR